MDGYWLGLDVGGTTTRAGVADSSGGLLRRASAPTPPTRDQFVATLDTLTAQLELDAKVHGVGVGIPGMPGEWVPNVPDLADPALVEQLADRLAAPITIGNDAQLALLGEARAGAARDVASALLVSIGTGVGGAVMQAGRLLRGAHGSAGAIGWFVTDISDPGDPDHGALERRAGGRALNETGAALDPPRDSYRLIADARAGVPDAVEVVSRVGRDLGAAIASVGSVVDPSIVLIAGGLSAAFDLMRTPIVDAIERWASPHLRTVPVRAAALGDDAGLIGATYAAREGGDAWW